MDINETVSMRNVFVAVAVAQCEWAFNFDDFAVVNVFVLRVSGKYAMHQLVQKLPCEDKPSDFPVSDETITAVQATLYEVVRSTPEFARYVTKGSFILERKRKRHRF